MPEWKWPEWSVFTAGAALRALKMNWPIRGDEAYTFIWFASKPLSQIVSDYSSVNNHIFHNLLMHMAYVAFGPSEYVLRAPVYLAGLAVMGLSWQLAYTITRNEKTALLTLILTAFSSYMIQYSCEARGYMIITALGLLTALLWLSHASHATKTWGVGTLCFLMCWTVLSAVVFVVPFYSYAYFHPKGIKFWKATTLTAVLCLIAYAPQYKNLNAFLHGKQTIDIPTKADLSIQYHAAVRQAFGGLH